ncbi:MAG: sugar transferase, partial [Elusimicrobia bacterium]|nr:sugar transferase [Elusimicrobiota bacterium]
LFLLGGAAVGYVFSAVWHIGVHIYYRDSRARGVNQRMALVVGDSYSLPGVLAAFSSNAGSALKPIAVLSTDDVNPALLPPGVKCEKLSRLKEILNTTVVDCAVFCIYRQDPQRVEVAMLACQERGIEVWLKMDFLHQEVAVSTVDYLQDIPMFIFSMGPRYSLALLLKRLIDIAVAAAVLAILALPLALVAALIPWFNPGPIFFRQRRVGLNGREFTVYKFRSMYVDAESRREEYSLKNEMHGPVFKMQKDPRVTPFGRLLRKYSIDEFPQLWNVLVGDMSLVGPRPPLPSEVNQYSGWQRRRLSMRPGISGLWQIRGRNRIADFADWVRLDLKYIDEWSLWLDFKILAMTVPTVLRGTGY